MAGVTRMEFHRYAALRGPRRRLWVTIFLGAGYLFGNVPWVQDYLAVALAIAVAASAIPGFVIWAACATCAAAGLVTTDHPGTPSGCERMRAH